MMSIQEYRINKGWANTHLNSNESAVALAIDHGAKNVYDIQKECMGLTMSQIQAGITNLHQRGLLTIGSREVPRTSVKGIPSMETSDVELKPLVDFDLSQIDEMFEIAEFERPVSRYNVMNILEAIERRQFYDNIISVTPPKKNGKYGVMDGQHRLTALKLAFRSGKLQTFTLVLRIFKTADAREVYRRINSGKPLTMNDFIKSLDDGKVEFFNAFRAFCSHYPERHKVTYQALAYGLLYAKSESNNLGYTKKRTIQSLTEISEADIKMVRTFLTLLRETVGTDTRGSLYYKGSVFLALLRAFYKKRDNKAFIQMLKAIEGDAVILENAKSGRRGDGMMVIYSRILEKF